MIFNATKIGDSVCDMHYGGRFRSHVQLNAFFAVRNVIEFPLSDADSLSDRTQGRNLEAWLDKLSRDAKHGPYCNKMLIIVGESSDDGWLRVAYMYDSRRVGFAEIKRHSDKLSDALTKG